MRHPVALLAVLAAGALAARPSAAQANPDVPTRALLVGHGGLLNFNGFRGAGLAFKRIRGDRALRVGLTVGLSGRTTDGSQTTEVSGTSPLPARVSEGGQMSLGLGVFAQGERRWAGRGPLRPYAFAGPFLDVSHVRNESTERTTVGDPVAADPDLIAERSQTDFAVRGGLGGGVGVEWRLTRGIGALLEYGGSLALLRQVDRDESVNRTESPSDPTRTTTSRLRSVQHGFDLRTDGVTVGVALYF